MRSKLALIVISLLVAAATTVTACSSGEPVADEQPTEPPQYQTVESTDSDDQRAQQPQPQPPTQPPGGEQPEQPAAEMPEATGPVATVNGEEIPADAFNEQIEQLSQQAGHLPPQYIAQMQDEIVDQLIQKKLLDDAVDEADIEVTDEEVDARRDELREEFEQTSQAQLGEEMDFDEFVSRMGMTPEELDEVLEETVAIEKLLEHRGEDMPTEQDVRAFYDDNPEMFTEPEHVEARQLAIPVNTTEDQAWEEAEQTIEEIHHRVTEEGASFEEIAAEYDNVQADEAPIAREQQGQLPAEIIDTAFDELETGEISEPIRTEYGFVIIERTGYQEESIAEFEEVEEQLEAELRQQAMEESLQEFLTELEAQADVQRHPENIE